MVLQVRLFKQSTRSSYKGGGLSGGVISDYYANRDGTRKDALFYGQCSPCDARTAITIWKAMGLGPEWILQAEEDPSIPVPVQYEAVKAPAAPAAEATPQPRRWHPHTPCVPCIQASVAAPSNRFREPR